MAQLKATTIDGNLNITGTVTRNTDLTIDTSTSTDKNTDTHNNQRIYTKHGLLIAAGEDAKLDASADSGSQFKNDLLTLSADGQVIIRTNCEKNNGAQPNLKTYTFNSGTITAETFSGNAATASKFNSARIIQLTGDVTGSVSADGSSGWSITTTVQDDSHNHIISNIDGLQGSLDGKAFKPAVATEDRNRPLILGGNSDNSSWDSNTLYYANSLSSAKRITGNPGTGNITAASFNALSDARLKENLEPFKTEKSILDLPTYKFDFIDGAKNQIGCKAQDLQAICPEIVTEGDDGYLSIQESKIVYLLLEEVKKLRKEIDELKGV